MTETPAYRPTTFADLGLREELVGALADLGYEEPTPIQQAAIPLLMEGRDVLGQAATGTGKTAAFALPILQRLGLGERGRQPVALILVPTRELAMQVSQALHRYGRQLGVRVVPIYGGQPIGHQLRSLEAGVDVVVATPGRAVDHLGRKTLRLAALEVVVLDEADEMLDMGFAEDLETILAETSADRQTVLFSATLPARIDAIARRHLRRPERIQIAEPAADDQETPLVRHEAYILQRAHKAAGLGRVLDVETPAAALVFCRTREGVDTLTETLNGRGYRAEALHGGMSQEQRDRVMGRLRTGTADLLVATDVAARGLDIDQLSHVVNFDMPASVESYIHRMGRVGRAGREGVAITLAEPREHRMLKTIERVTKRRIAIQKVPTVADLRARRLDLTRAALRESILEDDLDGFRVVVESLADEFDVMEVAMAAVKLAHAATGPDDDDEDIPDAPVGAPPTAARRGQGKGQGDAGSRRSSHPASGTTRLYISVGRDAGVRPQDLVGAITGETHLSGRDLGSIEITQRFSLVEVPEDQADEVIDAMRRAKIRGRKATVRRERF
ncbi:MAG TPA: DEAD/DEAH box helicase [Acidimicrobiales bacterium]|nr:DEAD/DEAH box helicase [Acidimicrobiales bacterium]